jgi:hypothetical protein
MKIIGGKDNGMNYPPAKDGWVSNSINCLLPRKDRSLMSRQLAQPVVPTVFNFSSLFLQESPNLKKVNSTLTFEFYLNKLDCLTVFCSKPDIQFRKNLKAWFSPSKDIIHGLVKFFDFNLRIGVHSSHRLKTGGFSGRNAG